MFNLRASIASGILAWIVVGAGPWPAGVAQAQNPSGGQAWSGSVTVTRNASGALKSDDGKASLGFTGSETITFQLGPDGTASYVSTFHNNYDMNGEYGIPTFGSGSGTTYYDIGFNGVNWEVSIDGGDDIPIETNHTGENLWWAYQFRELIKFGEMVEGKKAPAYNGRVEKGGRGVNGAVFAAQGDANAKSLSGSHTETLITSGPEGLEQPPNVPVTVTVSWNLALGPRQPHVAIHGPDCGCLDAIDPESTPLKFRAGTTVPGGEFSEFEVIPEGQKPEIVSNQGGERPELILKGTKDTGAVTLKIHYTKDGKRYDAAPFRVEFCTLEEVKLKDDEHDLAFHQETLDVEAKMKAWHNGEEVSQEVKWELEEMGGPTKLSSDPADKKGEKIKFSYEGLPEKNESFGPKNLNASINRGKCSCRQRETVRTFFVGDDASHPGDDSPNWFYYWSQTSAVGASVTPSLRYQSMIVDPNLPTARPIAKYDPETQKLLLSDLVYVPHGCRGEVDRATHTASGKSNEGIDCFAENVRHEWRHRQDAIDWWGSPAGFYGVSVAVWLAKDWDHDQVPNEVEDRETGCKHGTWGPSLSSAGGQETWFTCHARPFPDATDAEINAYYAGWMWPTGSLNDADWSCGPLGKQWHGKSCGN